MLPPEGGDVNPVRDPAIERHRDARIERRPHAHSGIEDFEDGEVAERIGRARPSDAARVRSLGGEGHVADLIEVDSRLAAGPVADLEILQAIHARQIEIG